MKILVTGSSGFVGARVYQRLSIAGHDVVPFDVTDGHNILDRDSIDRAVRAGVEIVYHIAAQADLTRILHLDDGCRTMQLNVIGTDNVARSCARHHVWLIYVSTCCVYGNQDKLPAHEDTSVPSPAELYAFTKLAGEEIVRGYGASFGLPHTILRPSTIYGPGMRPALAPYVFFDQARRGVDITVHGSGAQTRAQLYVTDLVDGIVAAQRCADAKGHIINLAGSQSVSAMQMAEDIRRIANSSSRIVHVKDRPNQIFHEHVSIEKAKALLNWRPRTSWDEGLKKTAVWLQGRRGRIQSRAA